MAAEYPECEKWGKVHGDAVAITEFIGWDEDRYPSDQYKPPLQTRLYEFFEIDANKLEEERREMLANLQKH